MTRVYSIIGMTALLVIASGYASTVPAEAPELMIAGECEMPLYAELQQWGDPDNDLNSCQQDCRSRYGIDKYVLQRQGGGSGGGSYGGYYLYSQCVENCNRSFWKKFDQRMDELK
jgi:hypothetical protein